MFIFIHEVRCTLCLPTYQTVQEIDNIRLLYDIMTLKHLYTLHLHLQLSVLLTLSWVWWGTTGPPARSRELSNLQIHITAKTYLFNWFYLPIFITKTFTSFICFLFKFCVNKWIVNIQQPTILLKMLRNPCLQLLKIIQTKIYIFNLNRGTIIV